MSKAITEQDRAMAQAFRRYGPALVSPEWGNADGLDEAVERHMDDMEIDQARMAEIFERAANSEECRLAAMEFMQQFYSAGGEQAVSTARSLRITLYKIVQDIAMEEVLANG